MSVRLARRAAASLLVLAACAVIAVSAATAARSKANLRVTAKTQTTVDSAGNVSAPSNSYPMVLNIC
jgi:hypothetical protein